MGQADCSLSNVPVGILTNSGPQSPNIVIDNLEIHNVGHVVQVDKGATLLDGMPDDLHPYPVDPTLFNG